MDNAHKMQHHLDKITDRLARERTAKMLLEEALSKKQTKLEDGIPGLPELF